MNTARIFSIGLTGGIGSGKSLVADLFAARGAAIVDTDVIAHGLTAPGGAAIEAIAAAFGAGFLDASGAMDRARMRQTVFADPAARKKLEAILHPMIRAATDRAARRTVRSWTGTGTETRTAAQARPEAGRPI